VEGNTKVGYLRRLLLPERFYSRLYGSDWEENVTRSDRREFQSDLREERVKLINKARKPREKHTERALKSGDILGCSSLE